MLKTCKIICHREHVAIYKQKAIFSVPDDLCLPRLPVPKQRRPNQPHKRKYKGKGKCKKLTTDQGNPCALSKVVKVHCCTMSVSDISRYQLI